MKKYFKEISSSGFNAGFKARNDVNTILEKEGFEPVEIEIFDNPNKFSNKIKRLLEVYRLRRALVDTDELFIQYPIFTYRNKLGLIKFFMGKHKGAVTLLVHDIHGYREASSLDEEFKFLASRANRIIAHTPAMARRLESEAGLAPGSVEILNLFDYLTDDKVEEPNLDGMTIIFAGNLSQCGFLSRLNELPDSLDFNIYGVYSDNVVENSRCRYCGKFSPDNISMIEGNWGLVWHGPSIETSAGNIGEYLRIISSHKISLYLAACKPVILWDESSIADFIVKNKLGIAVSSLQDIDKAIDSLTADDKRQIAENVSLMSRKLRNGEMLHRFI